MMWRIANRIALTLLCLVLMIQPMAAGGPDGVVPVAPAIKSPPAARIDEQIGAQVPLDLVFKDEDGQPITLGECTQGKVTILVPVYYRCPMLCTQTLNGLLEALRQMPLDFTVGGKFNVVNFSLDPKEHHSMGRDKKAVYLGEYGRPNTEKGWRFLTGSEQSIKTLTEVIGYRYEYDRAFKEYNHPSGIIILTPEGKVARYFYGIGFDGEYRIPGGMTTLRLSLVEASEGKIGSLLDQLILACYRFDHSRGYSLQIMRVVQLASLLTLIIMVSWIIVTLRRERQALALAPIPTLEDVIARNDAPQSGGNS